jgi:hypothetical protein
MAGMEWSGVAPVTGWAGISLRSDCPANGSHVASAGILVPVFHRSNFVP